MNFEFFGIASVAAVSVICWLAGEAVKLSPIDNKWIPCICGVVGAALGFCGLKTMPEFPAGDIMSAIAVGIVSGLAATGADQLLKQLRGDNKTDTAPEQAGKHEKPTDYNM